MNKTFTCLSILSLALLALALCIKQTFEIRELMAGSSLAIIVTLEGLAAGFMIASAVSLLRKRFARQKKPASRQPIAEVARA